MKKKYVLLEFALVSGFFALPLLFLQNPDTTVEFKLSWGLLIQALLTFLLQLHFTDTKKTASLRIPETVFPFNRKIKNSEDQLLSRETKTSGSPHSEITPADIKTSKTCRLFTILKWAPITFGLMMLIYAANVSLHFLLPDTFPGSTVIPVYPKSAVQWFAAVIKLLLAAFFEEQLYRQFFPECLHYLTPEKWAQNKWIYAAEEFAVLTLFAASHYYMGLLAVLNAFTCGIVLRLCRIKTQSIYTGSLVHFLYNLTLLIFAFLMEISA